MAAGQRVQGTNISEVAAGCAEPHSPACVSSNSYERVLQPTTVSQDGDRIHGLGMPPLIAATALTLSPAGAAALIQVNRFSPKSTSTARSDRTHEASWLESQRCSINEPMERPVRRQLCQLWRSSQQSQRRVFEARERARKTPEPLLA